jgi:hypothetical protein
MVQFLTASRPRQTCGVGLGDSRSRPVAPVAPCGNAPVSGPEVPGMFVVTGSISRPTAIRSEPLGDRPSTCRGRRTAHLGCAGSARPTICVEPSCYRLPSARDTSDRRLLHGAAVCVRRSSPSAEVARSEGEKHLPPWALERSTPSLPWSAKLPGIDVAIPSSARVPLAAAHRKPFSADAPRPPRQRVGGSILRNS